MQAPSESMKKDKLLAIAKEKQVEVDPALTKAEIVEVLKSASKEAEKQDKPKAKSDVSGMASTKKFDKFKN